MPKGPDRYDVLILGGHPCAYVAAALLGHKSSLNVIHAPLPDEPLPQRLVLVNPGVFELNKLLAPVQRKVALADTYGLHFLANESGVASEYRSRGVAAHLVWLHE